MKKLSARIHRLLVVLGLGLLAIVLTIGWHFLFAVQMKETGIIVALDLFCIVIVSFFICWVLFGSSGWFDPLWYELTSKVKEEEREKQFGANVCC